MAESALSVCLETGFDGPVWGVNPRREKMAGRPCFAAVSDLPEPPDAVFLAVHRDSAIDIVRELSEFGAGGIVMFTAGFGELGSEGMGLERQLIEAAGSLALVGPNCYGLLNLKHGVTLWPFGHGSERCKRGVAIISQSGMMGFNLSVNRRSVPLTHFISSGNQAVLGVEDYIDALIEDPAVTAIGLYIEALNAPDRFADAAARALVAGKPIVALKGGRSEIGARLTMTHTGSLSGTDDVYQALFDRLGIIRVNTTIELLETLKFLTIAGVPEGKRIAAFTCSGGDATLIVDNAMGLDLDFREPSPSARKKLAGLLPDIATISNPLDYTTPLWGAGEQLRPVLTALLEDGYDAALLAQDYPRTDMLAGIEHYQADTEMFAAAVRETGIAGGVCSNLSENLPRPARETMIGLGIAPMQGIAEAVGAVAAAAGYGTFRRQALAGDGTAYLALPGDLPEIADSRPLDEFEAKQLLQAAGVSVPRGRLVAPEDAPAAAGDVGFPVVAKLAAADLAHKSEAGAVRLGLTDQAQVERAVTEMLQALASHHPEITIAGVLVESMVREPLAEILVSVRREPPFGQVMVLASGGILVELIADARTLLLPADRAAIKVAIDELKVSTLLRGFRGTAAADMEAVVDTIVAIAAFADQCRDDLVELEINPLMITATGAFAVDALMRLRCDT